MVMELLINSAFCWMGVGQVKKALSFDVFYYMQVVNMHAEVFSRCL